MRLKSHHTHSNTFLMDKVGFAVVLQLVHIVLKNPFFISGHNSALSGSLWNLDSNDAQSCLRWSLLASENLCEVPIEPVCVHFQFRGGFTVLWTFSVHASSNPIPQGSSRHRGHTVYAYSFEAHPWGQNHDRQPPAPISALFHSQHINLIYFLGHSCWFPFHMKLKKHKVTNVHAKRLIH